MLASFTVSEKVIAPEPEPEAPIVEEPTDTSGDIGNVNNPDKNRAGADMSEVANVYTGSEAESSGTRLYSGVGGLAFILRQYANDDPPSNPKSTCDRRQPGRKQGALC